MTNQNYQRIYQETIEKLKQGVRPQVKLTPELLLEIKAEWEKAIANGVTQASQNETIKKILCILDNSQNTTSELNDLFIRTLKQVKDNEMLIYLLSASQKHVIADGLKSGIMISAEFFEILKGLLQSKNPEVKEWTLRTIESMGPLSMRFKQEVLNAKPGIMKLFNKHQKASAELINFLENEWKRMLK
ncbi:MAG: hypothetical protein K2Q18_07450 [Bdellovibrionales bacterium]|nr:hypothetical protein [Bdellovibrionales bacterium]